MASADICNSSCTNVSSQIKRGNFDAMSIGRLIKYLKEAYRQNKDKKGSVRVDWTAFGDIFPDPILEDALKILDRRGVSYYCLKDDPNIGAYQVTTSIDARSIMKSINACSCRFYIERVQTEEVLMCVHVLACLLAECMDRVVTVQATPGLVRLVLECAVNDHPD